jgi:hypothetical protein
VAFISTVGIGNPERRKAKPVNAMPEEVSAVKCTTMPGYRRGAENRQRQLATLTIVTLSLIAPKLRLLSGVLLHPVHHGRVAAPKTCRRHL